MLPKTGIGLSCKDWYSDICGVEMSMGSLTINFCYHCGSVMTRQIPASDNRMRDVCKSCGIIHYQNPTIITGCLPVFGDKILLCKRGIEPRKGFWTLPAGFMELGETIEEGAARETLEEAGAIVRIKSLYTLFDVAHAGQVSMFFLASMSSPEYQAGSESLEVALFREEDIPWDDLSFSTVSRTLRYYFHDREIRRYPLHRDRIMPLSLQAQENG
ncbi:NADH pyrophosphatase [invertebrate metagenome]|uniref:NADH pyrophosphatase n=1 Tax=invertebrate metagenome TaxID=1711999 RepID=A0A2H9T9P4_9ZZZZ